ncbi:MAG: hypothetical protein DRJ29_18480 [Bacteroidetes bacterium]|nr:MAG: hypothetical protein DRJ29_18480 [Bacteroidota bacterium]
MHTACSDPKEIPQHFYGNYFDSSGKEYWTCLIQKDQIIYKNNFWNYKIKSSSEKVIELQISNKSEDKIKLQVHKQDSIYTIVTDNEEITCI